MKRVWMQRGSLVRVISEKICYQYGSTGISVGDVVEVIDNTPFPNRDDIVIVDYDEMLLIVSTKHTEKV